MIPESVRIVEVGPRDGLQNEAVRLSVERRVHLIEQLAGTGLKTIEAGSFVSPKWVPQMAGTEEVIARLDLARDVAFPVLVPNLKGLEAARVAGVREIAIFAAASESFSQKNINCSIAESLDRLGQVAEQALAAGLRVRGYVSCVLGCPYEGEIALDAVATVSRRLYEMGCYEISLGDTIGVGTPLKARRMVERVARDVPLTQLALHLHDTYGQALANVFACLELGVRVFDASVAGLGGCPYAKGASGNLATEDLVYMLDGMNVATGVDLTRLSAVAGTIAAELNRARGSRDAGS